LAANPFVFTIVLERSFAKCSSISDFELLFDVVDGAEPQREDDDDDDGNDNDGDDIIEDDDDSDHESKDEEMKDEELSKPKTETRKRKALDGDGEGSPNKKVSHSFYFVRTLLIILKFKVLCFERHQKNATENTFVLVFSVLKRTFLCN